jgi:hypothetical protein
MFLDNYRTRRYYDAWWGLRHARRLHRLNDSGRHALPGEMDHILSRYRLGHPRIVYVVGNQLGIDASAVHSDNLIDGGPSLGDRTPQLCCDLGAVAGLDIV